VVAVVVAVLVVLAFLFRVTPGATVMAVATTPLAVVAVLARLVSHRLITLQVVAMGVLARLVR
jgi:hypothetical protein